MIEIPNLPDDLLAKDLVARQLLLDIWNSLGALSTVSKSDVEELLGKAIKLISKGLLRLLMFATNAFQDARLALHKKALEKCDQNNPNVLQLLRERERVEKLFGDSIVKEILSSSRALCRSVYSLIGSTS